MLGWFRADADRASFSKRLTRVGIRRDLARQNLDRDLAPEPRVPRPPYLAHPAGPSGATISKEPMRVPRLSVRPGAAGVANAPTAGDSRNSEEASLMRGEKGFDLAPELLVQSAGLRDERFPALRLPFERLLVNASCTRTQPSGVMARGRRARGASHARATTHFR